MACREKIQPTSLFFIVFNFGLAGCQPGLEITPTAPLSGGDTSFIDRSSHGYENPAPNLNPENFERHLEGDVAFDATFVAAPAEVNPGLGPLFVNNACSVCHIKNGRGLPTTGDGPLGSHLLIRVSLAEGESEVPGGVVPVPVLGDQLQDHAIYGESPEVTIDLSWTETAGTYGNGDAYSLIEPAFDIRLIDGSALGTEILTSARVPSPVFGLGLLEAVPDADLERMADPMDADGDGISGRINMVWDVQKEQTVPGRFGWKANQPNLIQQAAAAYLGDMGVTTPVFPGDDEIPDIDTKTMEDAAFYTQTLAVPLRANWSDVEVAQGELLFTQIGCSHCHTPTLVSGQHEIPALENQVFHPYTDLLLHDMGPGLADGRPDFEANGQEWRTAPLWGVGLAATVLGAEAYLHDGRARSLEEAILWHGGEGESAKERFRTLPVSDRERLLSFLRDL